MRWTTLTPHEIDGGYGMNQIVVLWKRIRAKQYAERLLLAAEYSRGTRLAFGAAGHEFTNYLETVELLAERIENNTIETPRPASDHQLKNYRFDIAKPEPSRVLTCDDPEWMVF